MEEGWYKLKREKRRGEKTRWKEEMDLWQDPFVHLYTWVWSSPLSADRSKLNISQEIQGRADLDISRWKKFIDMYISKSSFNFLSFFFFFLLLFYISLKISFFLLFSKFCFVNNNLFKRIWRFFQFH